MRPTGTWLASIALTVALTTAAQAQALRIELNRLDPSGAGCSVYFLLQNETARSFEELSLDLVMFDADGVVASRMAIEFAPLPADKTALRVFDVPDLACSEMSRILLNDAVGCRDARGVEGGCLEATQTSSRADVGFIK